MDKRHPASKEGELILEHPPCDFCMNGQHGSHALERYVFDDKIKLSLSCISCQIMDLERENNLLKEELASSGSTTASRRGQDEEWIPGRGGGPKHTLVRSFGLLVFAGIRLHT